MDESTTQGAPTGDISTPPRTLKIVAVAVAIVLQLIVGFFTLTSGLVAPLYGIALLSMAWVAAAVILIRLIRTRPFVTPLVPAVNALVWYGVLSLGGALLNWTA